jgi:hypothetical protein
MRVLWTYLEQRGRPVAFYTDKASLFRTTPKIARDEKLVPRDERQPLPPTQMGRALRELGIVWIPAHSPQAKGRVERSFGTAQDRLVKGLRVAGTRTLDEANQYLEEEFLPWWNQHLVIAPATAADAHRPLGPEHDLAASLSRVESRQVDNDYTFALDGKRHRITNEPMPAGLRGGLVRVERRLDGSLAARFRERYLRLEECAPSRRPLPTEVKRKAARSHLPPPPSDACRATMKGFLQKPSLPIWLAAKINRTRTRDRLD